MPPTDQQLMEEGSDLRRDIDTQGGNYAEQVAGNNIHAHIVNIYESSLDLPIAHTQSEKYCEKRKRGAFIIEGSLDLTPTQLAKLQAIERMLQQLTGDASLTVIDILEGSIRLVLEGSESGVDRLQELLDSGELTEILGFSVIAVEPVAEATIGKEFPRADPLKEMLIRAINTQGALGLDLRCSDLSGADLSHSNLIGANLRHANLIGANLSHANLIGANLIGADLSRANLRNSTISNETQLDAKWRLVHNIVNQSLAERNLIGANFSGANLSGANLSHAKLSGANLSHTKLISANLIGANLIGANLIGANLIGANLIGANLIDANLSGSDLSGSDLSGTNLSKANLSEADVTETILTQSTGLSEIEKVNLQSRGAIFHDAPSYGAELLMKYRQSQSVQVRNQLAQLNAGLVRKIAYRISHQCSEPYENLEQIGYLGLIRAIERFDPSQGRTFSSFAVPYIRGEILHFLRDRATAVTIPHYWQDLMTSSIDYLVSPSL
jgi:uncharacterized protein YjbI with pentapeptide repeats